MRSKLNIASTLLVTLAVAVGVSSCTLTSPSTTEKTSSSSASPAQTSQPTLKEVRLSSASVAVDYGPYLVAKNKGWIDEALKKKGITTNYQVFQSVPPVNEALATKRVDVVFVAEPPVIIGKAAGIDVKIVDLSCSLVQEILVPTNSKIQSEKDLKGKKIAVLAGSSSHYGVLKNLEEAGLQPSDVQIVNLLPPDAKAAFASGQVDAWAVWPPFVEQEELSGKGRVIPKGDAQIHSIMAVRGKFAQENPEVVQELVAVIQRAKKWLQENPGEAQQIIAKEINVPLNVVQKAWDRHNWAAQLTPAVVADIQSKANFLQEEKFIQKPVNVQADLVDLSFLKASSQSNVRAFSEKSLVTSSVNLKQTSLNPSLGH